MSNEKIKIFFVEDNLVDRKSFKRMVSSENLPYDFVIAESAGKAAEIVGSQHFDVAVVDYMLGDGTAFDLFEYLEDIPVIITTGAGDEEIAVKAMKSGACDYIIKDHSQNYLKFLPLVIDNAVKNSRSNKRFSYMHRLNQNLLAAIPSILIGVDSDFRITHWNKAAEKAFDIPAVEVLSKPFLYCGIEWDWSKVAAWITDFYRNVHTSVHEQMRYVRSDDKIGCLTVKICPFPCKNPEALGFLFVAEDCTDYKIMESQLVEAQKMKSMGKIASGIASEIKQPLERLNGYTSQIEQTLRRLYSNLENTAAYMPEDLLPNIELFRDNVDQIYDIIEATEQFSHPSLSENKIIDVNRSIKNILVVSKSYWKDTVSIKTDLAEDLPPVPCSGDTFNEVILNLLVNSVDAVSQKLEADNSHRGIVTIKSCLYSDWVKVHITDNGIGVPDEVKSKIFDPFFSTKRLGKDKGHGLAVCSRLIEREGGMLSFESEFGKWTTFTVHFNVKRNSDVENAIDIRKREESLIKNGL
jgi:nitrogen fixation/metabolism regulation signal transduction histidine kinase